MVEFLGNLNDVIESHQGLVTSVGLLIVVLLLTIWNTLLSNKAAAERKAVEIYAAKQNQKFEINIRTRIAISEFRQAWIDELRLEFATFLGLLRANSPGELDDLYMAIQKIQLRMNHGDPDFILLSESMTNALKEATGNLANDGEKFGDSSELNLLMGRILKREWHRLVDDLEKSESNENAA